MIPSSQDDQSNQANIPVMMTPGQKRTLELMEELGLSDPERLRIMADMVKQAAAWGYLKRWLIQSAAVVGAGGLLWGAIQTIKAFTEKGS